VLPLFPFQEGCIVDTGQPAVDRRAKLGLAPQPRGERDVSDAEPETATQLGERAKLVQLAQSIEAVPGLGPGGDDEPGLLEVAEHPGGPAGAGGRGADVKRIHPRDPNTPVSRLARADAGGRARNVEVTALRDLRFVRATERLELLLLDVAA